MSKTVAIIKNGIIIGMGVLDSGEGNEARMLSKVLLYMPAVHQHVSPWADVMDALQDVGLEGEEGLFSMSSYQRAHAFHEGTSMIEYATLLPGPGYSMPDQRSTTDQLEDLLRYAVSQKMYDAADWLKARLTK
jgi:hypothetical protein